MSNSPDLNARLDKVMRDDRGRLLSALISVLGDFELAEDALSDALESALIHWGRSGVPDNPIGWLLKVARRKAIDRIRRAKRFRDRLPDITLLAEMDEMDANEPRPEIPDERLRLIFTCCHPSLESKTQVALTLRTLGGLTTAEVASAFLDEDTTMGQRLSRARKKIAQAGIPFTTPEREQWDERLQSVLSVIYLIFNEGYSAGSGASVTRVDLCEEAIFLARLLGELSPNQAEVEGLLALMLITHSRRNARQDAQGRSVALEAQNRALWNVAMLEEGREVLDVAIARGDAGPYQIKAAINGLHATADKDAPVDWQQVLLLYDRLLIFENTPVVALNRATALAELRGAEAALPVFDALSEELDSYQPFHAAFAEYLRKSGQISRARISYNRAIELAGNAADREFLIAKRASISN